VPAAAVAMATKQTSLVVNKTMGLSTRLEGRGDNLEFKLVAF